MPGPVIMLISCWVNDTTLSPSPPAAEKEGILVCRQVVVVVAVAVVVVDVIAVVNAAIVVVDFLTGSRANRAGHKTEGKHNATATPITIHKMQHSNVSTKVTKGGNWVVKIYIENIHLQ